MDRISVIIHEILNRVINESKEQIIRDKKGNPIVFYHSYDQPRESNMIWLSADKTFSSEFGNTTEECYLKVKNPLVLKDDDILRYDDGTIVFFEGEPASIGYFDSVEEEYITWAMENYDSIMTNNLEFVIVFDSKDIIRKGID